ncbi:hypothetical protein B7453_25485 [Pseudomonas sp. IB20]|nr:hypothetical protein B7453_25485 [Pseudomonas sp. IB20]
MPCPIGHSLPLTEEPVGSPLASTHSQTDKPNSGGIVFGAGHRDGVALIPGYNTLAPHLRSLRDPSLSLIALSGIDPTGPVMEEVPFVLNNTTFTASELLSGWRIGFAYRYVLDEPMEHSAALRGAFDILCQAGAQLVPVNARRKDHTLQFTLQRNEIDELVSGHRLDALMSEDQSAAFHDACVSGYPSFSVPLAGGTKLWFYGAQWSRDALPTLLRAYRQLSANV